MPSAYVLVNTEKGYEEIVNNLRKIKNIIEINTVYGIYDIIIKVEAKTMEEMKKTIMNIRQFNDIKASLTMIIVES